LKKLNRWIVKQNGFSLLEVMFALALIGISLTTLLASQSQGLGLANEAKFNTTATLLAQAKMTELEIADIKDLISDSGDFDEEIYPEYSWEVEIDKTSIPALEQYADHYKQIDLHIYFGEKRIYQYDLRLYKYVE
jgi:prepilin-type N-terminal cleavage/methylation domain-containing protein